MSATSEKQPQVGHDQIAQLAEQIWEREGQQAGRDLEYWLQAERELLGRRNLASPTRPSPAAAVAAPAQRVRKVFRLPDSSTKLVHTS